MSETAMRRGCRGTARSMCHCRRSVSGVGFLTHQAGWSVGSTSSRWCDTNCRTLVARCPTHFTVHIMSETFYLGGEVAGLRDTEPDDALHPALLLVVDVGGEYCRVVVPHEVWPVGRELLPAGQRVHVTGCHRLLSPSFTARGKLPPRCACRPFTISPATNESSAMYRLSKSKLMSALQCAKRLYLEIHQPELAHIDSRTARSI